MLASLPMPYLEKGNYKLNTGLRHLFFLKSGTLTSKLDNRLILNYFQLYATHTWF